MMRRGHRLGRVACALLPLLVAEPTARAGAVSEDESLLYLDHADWQKQPAQRKLALTADFMRIFCTDQTMSAASLADCLDHDTANGAMFERAIACASAISAGR
ncbi:hypothetical protein JQ615_26680 [Bradyrhizobium jicamae]|uniref:UrcA family protein n=1 Tax=Bradyrhizobium jicamae TaxID=280332 RepID=A0ABS5FQ94_9BRAD|nr:hypothetical protein [Bradyrhizobium jicamae]MBR0798979.1 hypothetical protein [Bradyrhizobium jicamae]MBR0936802.1 hypothetical protein [Bradyrhizobium jicamae]